MPDQWTDALLIDPGAAWQYARAQSFNGRPRDKFLNGRSFGDLLKARIRMEDWHPAQREQTRLDPRPTQPSGLR